MGFASSEATRNVAAGFVDPDGGDPLRRFYILHLVLDGHDGGGYCSAQVISAVWNGNSRSPHGGPATDLDLFTSALDFLHQRGGRVRESVRPSHPGRRRILPYIGLRILAIRAFTPYIHRCV